MSALHAFLLETILLKRGLAIQKDGRKWIVSRNGKRVSYYPRTGIAQVDHLMAARRRETLRGSPERVAEILEELAQ